MSERTPELLPDIEPPRGGFERLLARRERRAGTLRLADLAVPASIIASCLLVVWVVQSRTPELDLSAIDAELYGRATAAEAAGYRVIKEPSSRPDVQIYTIETEPRRD